MLAIGLAAGCQSPGPPKKETLKKPPAEQAAEVEEKKPVEKTPPPGPVVSETEAKEPQAAPAPEPAPAEKPVAAEPETEVSAEPEKAPEEKEPPKPPAAEAPAAPSPGKEAATLRGGKPKLSKDKLKMRVNYLESLVYKSSSARKVEESGNEEAMATLSRSRELYEQAKAALEKDDLDGSDAAMRESMRLVGVASRMATSPEEKTAREREKYLQTKKSVESLLGAIDRVVKENGPEKEKLGVDPAPIHKLYDEAGALASGNKYREANVKIDEAYALASSAITKLRDKETILLTLEFETPEDEYKYVLKRNESYESLISIMIEEKKPGEGQLERIKGFVSEGRSTLEKAKKLASQGDFEQAIQVADEATGELAKALRTLGLMVYD